jgi:hypothetical protein
MADIQINGQHTRAINKIYELAARYEIPDYALHLVITVPENMNHSTTVAIGLGQDPSKDICEQFEKMKENLAKNGLVNHISEDNSVTWSRDFKTNLTSHDAGVTLLKPLSAALDMAPKQRFKP